MNNKLLSKMPICLIILISSVNTHAENWSLVAEMLMSNDDVVNYGDIYDTGNIESESDSALSYLVNAEYRWNDQWLTSFEFSDEQYQDQSQFDSHYHSVSLDWSQTIGDFDFSFYGSRIDIVLENTDLTLDMVSPSVSYFFSNGVFLNLSHTLLEKSFSNAALNDLSAKNNAMGLSAYYFFSNSSAFVSITHTDANENANDDNYDYDQKTTSVSLQKSFPFSGKSSKVNLSYAVRKRVYTEVNATDEQYRSFEDRTRIKIYFDTRLNTQWALRLSYDYKDRDSSLADYTYDNNYYSFRIQYKH
tara:strand:+ start:419 stop:1327 length:909 start_codon:yes stop_codon:yes gene_type:complete